ncbi:MAG: hypothetical protein K9N51_01635 [Candidatus Pacebacteria bacterium]|nr:hypothetical protein [Candidatus Paceibacterota bacterium]
MSIPFSDRSSALVIGCLALFLIVLCGAAADAATNPQTIAAASKAVSPAVRTASAVVAVPASTAQILQLPRGALEIVCCPLPGISIAQGLQHVGEGILAPFKLTANVLTLPYALVLGVSETAAAVPNSIIE